MTKVQQYVQDEEKGTKHQTLGDVMGDGGYGRFEIVYEMKM